jgi:hypothetical protein
MGKKLQDNREVVKRRVIQQHNTLYVSIPVSFRERHNIQKGDMMALLIGKDLTVVPLKDS